MSLSDEINTIVLTEKDMAAIQGSVEKGNRILPTDFLLTKYVKEFIKKIKDKLKKIKQIRQTGFGKVDDYSHNLVEAVIDKEAGEKLI